MQSNLVVEAVAVKDKQGNFVHGLTAKDFVLTEDGAPQTISFCEHQDLSETAKPLPPIDRVHRERHDLQPAGAHAHCTGNRWTTSATRIERLLALYFDMTRAAAGRPDARAEAAEQFVRTQMTTADLVSIMRYHGGSVDILQDFTAIAIGC